MAPRRRRSIRSQPVRRCRDCGWPIRFVRTEEDRWIPLDYRSSELNGNILVEKGTARQLNAFEARRAIDAGYELFTSHLLTCPNSRRRSRERSDRPRVPRPRWETLREQRQE